MSTSDHSQNPGVNLDETQQSAGGPAESAQSMPPRGTGTTASAARSSRSPEDAAAPDSGGAGPGLCPEWQRGKVREDLPDDRGIVQRGDQA